MLLAIGFDDEEGDVVDDRCNPEGVCGAHKKFAVDAERNRDNSEGSEVEDDRRDD